MALTCPLMPLDRPHMPLEPSGFPTLASEYSYLDLAVSDTDVPIRENRDSNNIFLLLKTI